MKNRLFWENILSKTVGYFTLILIIAVCGTALYMFVLASNPSYRFYWVGLLLIPIIFFVRLVYRLSFKNYSDGKQE